MANVRDSDTSLWLHNKLGTSNDTWINGSICSQLNVSVLRNIRECFVNLQTQVKLKLLLALLHTPRRNLEEWQVDIEEILEIAALDSDQWVSMLAEVMKTFPATGNFNTEIGNVEENRKIFGDLIQELQKLVRKTLDVELLPLECHYLNRAALAATTGQLPQPEKHFSLRRKPKSAALKLELLQKAQDVSAQLKKTVMPSVPVRSRVMPRKTDNSTPLRGIPSRLPSGGFTGTSNLSRLSAATGTPGRLARTPAGRKEGRVKMLDINEQPIGLQALQQQNKNKRKKVAEEEESKESAPVSAAGTPAQKKQKPLEERVNATPDYAAGLQSTNPPTPAPAAPAAAPAAAAAATAPDEPPPAAPRQAPAAPAVSNGVSLEARPAGQTAAGATPAAMLVSTQAMYQPHVPQDQAAMQQGFQSVPQQPSHQQQQPITQPYQQQQQQQQPQQQQMQPLLVPRVAEFGQQQQQQPAQPPQQQQQQQQQVAIIAQPQANTQRRGLTLTREQMLEAQEMFRTANKVTRPEKALILGFIAGSRENPCPHLGNVVTIKLSEDPESLQPSDGAGMVPMVAETHFQMNYSTGEWKRIKKFSRRDGVPA